MNELITNNPRGLELTYAVRVRGLPYLHTDGRATWAPFDGHAVLEDTLADSDFGFKCNVSPLDPLDVGTGMKIQLVDTSAGVLRKLYSPSYYGPDNGTRLAGDFTVDDTGNMPLVDGTSVAADDIIYSGLETFKVLAKPTTDTATVTRAWYKSQRMSHRLQATDSLIGPRVTKSPRVFRGRYVEVFVAGVMPDGTAGDAYVWWAGRLGSVSLSGTSVTLDVDPLNAAMELDDWPYITATATLAQGTSEISLPTASAQVALQLAPDGAPERYATLLLGYYNTSNTFTVLPTPAFYTIPQLITALSHTIQYAMLGTGLSQADGARNKFALSTDGNEIDRVFSGDNVLVSRYRNNTEMSVRLLDDTGFGALLRTISGNSEPYRTRFLSGDQRAWRIFANTRDIITPQQTDMRFTLDTRLRPFTLAAYSFPALASVGFARIAAGDRFEVISYSGVSLAADGRTMTLSGVKRGLARTDVQQWPPADNMDEKVTIEQLFAASYEENQFIFQILTALLVSSSTYPNQFNGPYDFFGEYGGLGIPGDFVWYEDIIAKLRAQYMPKAYMFFAPEAGSGKKALAAWLKLLGIHFVTKRFERAGSWYYGLTVDVVDSTRLTRYQDAVTDADRLAGTRAKVSYDERVVINQISYRPIYKFGENAEDENVGGMRYVYSEESIADYGAVKPMELKASAMFLGSQGYGDAYYSGEDLQTGIATECALRWFGVYDHAVLYLDMEAPHIAWRVQPGDQVLLSMTGVPSTTGAGNMGDVVGKCVRADYRTGENAGASLRFMITNTSAVEWAPSARVTTITGASTLTLDITGVYSDINATVPAIFGDPLPNYDGRFFRPSAYHPSLALPVVLYDARDYAGTAISTTVTGYTNAGNITVAANVSALAGAATAGRCIMTLGAAGALASARYAAHTFVDEDKRLG